jgi:VanZ family protein
MNMNKILDLILKVSLCLYLAVLAMLLTGPFQGAERLFNLSDKTAHAIAFYLLSIMALFALPGMRKNDIGLVIIAVAGASEAIQAILGRDGNWSDFVANCFGIGAAILPLFVRDIRRFKQGSQRRHRKLGPQKDLIG